MIIIPVTELKNLDDLIKRAEDGEICVLTKEGEPILELFPLKTKKKPGWKRKIKKVQLPAGISLQKIIEEERAEE